MCQFWWGQNLPLESCYMIHRDTICKPKYLKGAWSKEDQNIYIHIYVWILLTNALSAFVSKPFKKNFYRKRK